MHIYIYAHHLPWYKVKKMIRKIHNINLTFLSMVAARPNLCHSYVFIFLSLKGETQEDIVLQIWSWLQLKSILLNFIYLNDHLPLWHTDYHMDICIAFISPDTYLDPPTTFFLSVTWSGSGIYHSLPVFIIIYTFTNRPVGC